MPALPDSDMVPLGVLEPRGELGRAIDLALNNPSDAAAILRRHRVAGLGLRRLRERCADLPEPLQELARWRSVVDTSLESGWAELGEAVEETGIAVAGIKGMTMRSEYEHPHDRDAGDVDVMVADVDDAWQIVGWLRARGYD